MGHDVLVAFVSPHCKKCTDTVQPMLKELAAKSWKKGWDKLGLVIATFDVSKNDCFEDVSGTPKIVLYPAVSKDMKLSLKQTYTTGAKYEVDLAATFLLDYAKTLKGSNSEL